VRPDALVKFSLSQACLHELGLEGVDHLFAVGVRRSQATEARSPGRHLASRICHDRCLPARTMQGKRNAAAQLRYRQHQARMPGSPRPRCGRTQFLRLPRKSLIVSAEDLGGGPVGYTTTAWLSFGEALAAVAGALTGLLFVALSVRSGAVGASRSLRSRAAQTLVLFMTSVLVAVLLVAPQPSAALGWELLAVAVVSGTTLLILDRRAGHSADKGVARYIERFSPNMITAALVGVAGVTFLVQAGGGLYWLIPATMASLLGGVVNAWLFLVKVTG
jgi:hypothetical protein